MGFRVEVLPSGHRFEAEAGENLLEAALRAGLNITYNCSSGSCGECMARLLQGELSTLRHSDYRMSEAEQAAGAFLLCTRGAASDLRIEAREAGSSADIPRQSITTRVHRLELRGDYLILTLRTPRSHTLRFLAGQHVQLRLADGSCADLPLAGCPCNGMELQFHLHPQANEPSRQRLMQLQRGDEVQVEGPFGDFTLDEASPRPLWFIAEGEGFAPIKSLVEHTLALESGRPIEVLWLAPPGGHYLDNLGRSWADAVDELNYRPVNDEAALLAALPEQGDADIYLALSQSLLDQVVPRLLAVGTPDERIFSQLQRQRQRRQRLE